MRQKLHKWKNKIKLREYWSRKEKNTYEQFDTINWNLVERAIKNNCIKSVIENTTQDGAVMAKT